MAENVERKIRDTNDRQCIVDRTNYLDDLDVYAFFRG